MELAALIIQGISAILVAGGLFYAGKQLSLTLQVQKQNHDWNRRNAAQQATLDYPAKVTGAEKLNNALKYSVEKEPIPLATIDAKFEEDEELRIICHRLLNYHESLAVGVAQLVYDEAVVKGIRKSTMILLFNSFKNYIDSIRREIQPTAWEQQEKLINKWNHEDTDHTYREPTA